MNLLTAPLLILSAIVALEFAGGYQADEGINITVPVSQVPVPAIILAPAETPYLKPSNTPVIRPYIIDKDHDIWHAKDPGSYITPHNDWVKYYASQLYIDYDGRLRYKNKPIPLMIDTKGNVLSRVDQPFLNNYISDEEQFHFPPNGDVWVMPDYYLTNGMQDDCDGWMVTVTSLMLSGELSSRENESFVKKVIPTKAVLGYMGGIRDGWVEYQAYGKLFLTSTALVNTGINGGEKRSASEFIENKDKTTARPVFEFTDKYFCEYRAW